MKTYRAMSAVVVVTAVFVWLAGGMASSHAKEFHTVAVLPFSTQEEGNRKYVQEMIRYTLFTDLKQDEDIRLVPTNKVDEAMESFKRESLTPADIYLLGRKMDSDYIIYGSVSKVGFNSSIYIELINIKTYKNQYASFAVCHSMDDVIAKVRNFAREIDGVIGSK